MQTLTWTGTVTCTHWLCTQTHSGSQTHSLHTGWLWLSCNRWWGYCPRPACAPPLWQQAPAAQHLGSPGAPNANLTPAHSTQPGTQAVNPAIGCSTCREIALWDTFYSTTTSHLFVKFIKWQVGSHYIHICIKGVIRFTFLQYYSFSNPFI